MLSKNGIILTVKATSAGAWISHGGGKDKTVGLSIKPLLQYFYCHAENRNEQLIHFYDYKGMIKTIIGVMNLDYKRLHPDSVKELCALHDSLIAAHIPPVVQVLLRAQVNAGIREYAPINAEKAQELVSLKDGETPIGMYILRDIQNFKLAASLLHAVLTFQIGKKPSANYLELISKPMANWKSLLSHNGKEYRALGKTISTWKGKALTGGEFNLLSGIHLEQPLNSMAVRLLLKIKVMTLNDMSVENQAKLIQVIQRTKASDIAMLLKMPQVRERRGGYSNGDAYTNLAAYLRDGMRMGDESYAHIPTLIGMWNRALRDHEEDAARRAVTSRLEAENRKKGQAVWMATKTKELPFELPKDLREGIVFRFLDTVEAVHDEGDLMHHCIAGYSKQAVDGDSYLFHIEADGEMASAEISKTGQIKQIRGPHNYMNEACAIAGRILTDWVKNWGTEAAPRKKVEKANVPAI